MVIQIDKTQQTLNQFIDNNQFHYPPLIKPISFNPFLIKDNKQMPQCLHNHDQHRLLRDYLAQCQSIVAIFANSILIQFLFKVDIKMSSINDYLARGLTLKYLVVDSE